MPLQGRSSFHGLDISIERKKGSMRPWKNPKTGAKGETKMRHDYGYIKGTLGTDGDHVDVYLGPDLAGAKQVFVIDQMKIPEEGIEGTKPWTQFDEQKCMLGFATAEEAKKSYLAHFPDDRFFGKITTMSRKDFVDKVSDSKYKGKKLAHARLLFPRDLRPYIARFL